MDGFRTATGKATPYDPSHIHDDAERRQLVALREEVWQALEVAVRDRHVYDAVVYAYDLGMIETLIDLLGNESDESTQTIAA